MELVGSLSLILGTDATIHDHINTVITRGYVRRTKDRRLEPSPLGIALIAGFDSIGFSMSLSKPMLRRQVSGFLTFLAGRRS